MDLFNNKKIKALENELMLSRNEIKGLVIKASNTLEEFERVLAREHGSFSTYETLIRDYYKIGDPYMHNIYVRKCIDKISGMISSVNFEIVNSKDETLPDNNPSQQLFKYINDDDTPYDFIFDVIRNLQRFGKAFILSSNEKRKDGTPILLESLPADLVSAKTKDGLLLYWEMKMGGKKIQRFDPKRILFIKYKHPYNIYDGLSPTSSATKEILQDFYAQTYNIKYFQNGAMGKGFFYDPEGRPLTPQQKTEAQFAVDNTFNKGVDEAGKTSFLNRKLAWQKTSDSNKDMQFEKLIMIMRDAIFNTFEIPKVIFASADSTFSNLKEAKKLLWNQVLKPICKKIEVAFNSNFFAKLGLDYKFKFKLEEVKDLQEDVSEKMDSALKMWQMGVPIKIINNVLGLGLPEEGWEGWDKPKRNEPAFPFMDNGEEEPKEESIKVDVAKIIAEYKKQKKYEYEKSINHDEFIRQIEYQKSLHVMLSYEKQLSNSVKNFFSEKYQEEIERFFKLQPIKSVDKSLVDPNWIKQFKAYLKKIEWAIPFWNQIKPYIERTFNQGVFRTYDGLGMNFNLSSQRTLNFLMKRGLKLKNAPQKVIDSIITMLDSETFTIDEMAKDISKKWKNCSYERAKVISITETTAAYNGGRVEGMKELGIKKKQWSHSHDSKVRFSHRIDQIVEVDENFTLADGEQVMYPGSGSAKNSCNCRCVCVSYLD